ncbi:hypothetical protein DM860_014469 [Cuscuta australis]|uniref:Uncharacterized protein n=1 Tax=Cuscuta australis TaxID=267555 RepID=A0A328DXP9_9ASTE|nr:hypothetical protein DM860_014469 [Cuscuta australis]
MSQGKATMVDDGVEYSFAMEYHGPPIAHELPRAVPINVDMIPVASVVSQIPLSHRFGLPVVHPISVSDVAKGFSKELKRSSNSTVSPTSVISLDRRSTRYEDESARKELALGSQTNLSPCSVNDVIDERLPSSSDCIPNDESSSSSRVEGEGEFSGAINISTELGSSSSRQEHSDELLGRVGSSGDFRFSSSFEMSREFSGSSQRVKRFPTSGKGSEPDWASNGSVMSFDYPSSRVSSSKFEDNSNEHGQELKRGSIVTFCNIKSDDEDIRDEFSGPEPEVTRPKKEPQVKVKKGVCYRCCKGNRFTEKEVCIVCDAKYCSRCVLRAMGSMPEGRKCVTCIGYPIDESKRGNLGKCSRILKRLLNELEIQQIMKTEKSCEVNQLPPEYVCVNGRPLCHEELVILQNCAKPPKKLNPGNYWYDKVSGLWGKDGQRPSQIISAHLNVGGPIKVNASNGNTQVHINGREITKGELRMLRLAGVQCAGNPHFWVNDDGSYQEEGQKNTKGYIWGKAGMKLVYAVFSLPIPSKSSSVSGDQMTDSLNRSVPGYLEQRTLQKLLLVGYSGSGTSTVFKQAKILYNDVPFTDDECQHIKSVVQSNVYRYIAILLEGRERFEEQYLNALPMKQPSDESDQAGQSGGNDRKNLYSISARLRAFSDWLLKIMASGNLEAVFPAATREYAPLIEELWNDAAIQATYRRRSELETLPGAANYFLERAVDILKVDYQPSDVDILYAEGVTSSNGLSCMDFSFPEAANNDSIDSCIQPDSLLRFQLIRVQAKGFGENCKWIEMFEDVRIVIFCVSLSDYDQYRVDETGELVNKMVLTKRFFESVVSHPTFDQMNFLVLLNKFDLFEEKVERVPLTKCEWFADFHPVISRHGSNHSPSLGHLAFHYIAVKFKRLFSALTDRKLYVSMVRGLDPKSVDESLKYAREILKWDDERPNFSFSESSFYSTDASSISP